MLIDATHAEETRVVVVDGNKVEEFDFESQFKRQLAGNIYLAKVTRVEPSLQAAFVDYGGNRHGFLAFSEIHPDYYQIPVADREALIAEEKAFAESLMVEDDEEDKPNKRRRSRSRPKAVDATSSDAVVTTDVAEGTYKIAGMETIDFEDSEEGSSPMFLVSETPVETPKSDSATISEDSALSGDDESIPNDHAEFENEDEIAKSDAHAKDDNIESVTTRDDTDDVRPVRKPRPKRYKIQEVVKVRQILLIQVVKEERGNKGAALTTYLSLAGRYCVLMPNTARGGGISRKITNAPDRKKLKEIASGMEVPEGAGLIIRTAGSQRTKSEIKRDYEYLQRLWEQIRELTLKSIAPAKIYEEGDLIKRSIRDLYNKDIDEVIVAGEVGYRTAKDFMKMIMPSHSKNVKRYTEQLPLYARYQVEGYLNGMFNPTVQLPSGGYIVIGITEALVAIDVNSGRATKEGSIEQTATKTNLEAADEVARQLRLRDLAGLIVIDFIDMDERRNNLSVEKRMKDALKVDRARIQVGRISGFGLMEMSRQRLRPGMLEATTQMCGHCHGTGLLRSDDNVALSILRSLEEEGVRGRSKEVLIKTPISIANFLMNGKREHIADIEARHGMSIRIECDPTLVSPDFSIEKFKMATRVVPDAAIVVVATVAMMDDDNTDVLLDSADTNEDAVETEAQTNDETTQAAEGVEGSDSEDRPRKKRRRRRRRKSGNGEQIEETVESLNEVDAVPLALPETTEEQPKTEKPKRSRTRSRKKVEDLPEDAPTDVSLPIVAEVTPVEKTDEAAAEPISDKPKRTPRIRKKAVPKISAPADVTDTSPSEETPIVSEKPKPKRKSRAKPKSDVVAEAHIEIIPELAKSVPVDENIVGFEPKLIAEPAVVVKIEEPQSVVVPELVDEPKPVLDTKPVEKNSETVVTDKPKRKGWWSLGR